jgi:ADP-heptose:LPS heptosyltransferase
LRLGILGGNDDRALGGAIAAVNPARCLDLTGRTSLPEMIEWIRLSELTITNDTGPMHVAAALGTPVVAIFGSTAPELTGPGLPGDSRHCLLKADVPCSPCFLRGCPIDLRCLKGVEVGKVVESILRACETPREKL